MSLMNYGNIMHMRVRLNKNQQGALSMLTVIFISVVLTILTTSFIRLTINEQRESIDDDLTTRAFYAAESGVQDALAAVKSNTVDAAKSTECAPNSGDGVLSTPDGLDVAYTCQTIDLSPTSYEAYLLENETVFFKLESTSDINSLTISWHIKGTSSDSDGAAVAHTTNELKKLGEWNDGSGGLYPAMLRTQLISVPESNATRETTKNYIAFFNPTSTGTGSTTLAGMNGGISSSGCDFSVDDGAYVCSVEVTGLVDSANDYYVRLQALYRPTHVKIKAFTSSGVSVEIVNAQAVIDVTGRASDVYRRIEKRVSLVPDDLWPDFAILSAEDICKDFIITDAVSGSEKGFISINTPINGSCRGN